jgi:hypothetical protein
LLPARIDHPDIVGKGLPTYGLISRVACLIREANKPTGPRKPRAFSRISRGIETLRRWDVRQLPTGA